MLRNFARLIIAALLIGVLLHMGIMYSQVPNDIPSRFDLNGNVVASMEKDPFFLLFLCMQLGILIGLPVLGMLIKHMPNELINVPNKEYWLAAERRDETLNVAGLVLDLTAIATGVLMALILHLSCLVSLDPKFDSQPWIWVGMIGYMSFIAGVVVHSLLRFRKPSEKSTTVLDSNVKN